VRKKQERFKQNEVNPLVVQQGKPIFDNIKGKWRDVFFKNQNNIVLELACGRGEYTIGLGQLFPNVNFLGVDIKGIRIWKGAQFASDTGMGNVGFLRAQMHMVDRFFEENEVNEIWLVHPDPRPRDSDERRRLTNIRYMAMYRNILKQGGVFRLKTDSTFLFEYTLKVIENMEDVTCLEYTSDLYNSSLLNDHYDIKTRYEQEFANKGESIKYLKLVFQ